MEEKKAVGRPKKEVAEKKEVKALNFKEDFEQELEQIISKPDKNTFNKLCQLRAKVEKGLKADPSLVDMFLRVNAEMRKNVG